MNEEALLQRLSALEERLRVLESAQDSRRQGGLLRDTRSCPSCHGQEILFIKKLEADAYNNNKLPLRVATASRNWSPKPLGIFQAYVCAGCGYGELQLNDPASIKDQPHVEVLSSLEDPTPEPYR